MVDNKHKVFSISIVGSGNVAWHLVHAFIEQKHRINTIISRNTVAGEELASLAGTRHTDDFSIDNSSSDFVILAVNDSCLTEVADKITSKNTIVLHTSGSIDMNIFAGKAQNFGVFYPFQTLTKGVNVDYRSIPVCIEASDKKILSLIHEFAVTISTNIHRIDSGKRRMLHLAAALSNNFINHLIAQAFDYLEKNKIEKDLLFPLLRETLHKLEKVSPREAQTGPARRKNMEILEAHKKMLENETDLKNLYSLISDSIITYYS